jgi:acetyl esterase/lipase
VPYFFDKSGGIIKVVINNGMGAAMRQSFRGFLAVLLFLATITVASYGCSFALAKAYLEERDVVYKTVGDCCLKMDIYRPTSPDGLTPAVVYIHGGGWYSGDKTTGAGQDDISEMISRGYVVAAINYRLAPRYQFPAQIEDVKCAIRFLRANAAQYGIDAAHIGVWGDSAGGHLAALLGVTDASDGFEGYGWYDEQSDQVQAVASLYGPTDLADFYKNDNSPHIEHVFGTADRESAIISQASPLTYVSDDNPPFLIVHGEEDEVVAVTQSQAFYERLVSADVPATLVIVENCGHCFTPVGEPINPTRTQITLMLADFFDQYLKCEAAP